METRDIHDDPFNPVIDIEQLVACQRLADAANEWAIALGKHLSLWQAGIKDCLPPCGYAEWDEKLLAAVAQWRQEYFS